MIKRHQLKKLLELLSVYVGCLILEKHTTFYAKFGHDYTDFHQILNYVHINLGQNQLTTPDCISNADLQPDFQEKLGR